MIEKYSKAQIVAAIKDLNSWNHGLERQIVLCIQRMESGRLYSEYEQAEEKSIAALNAFGEFLKTLSSRYGGKIPITKLTADERDEYIRLAEESERAGKLADERLEKYSRFTKLPVS